MPELPEVETVRRGLIEILHDQPVIEAVVAARKDIRDPIPMAKIRRLIGHPLQGIARRGKYLLFQTEAGFLLNHLGMTGSWRLAEAREPRGPHDHFELHFGGGRQLIYRDPRRFGIIDWGDDPAKHPRLKDLGPEPFAPEFNGDFIFDKTRGRRTPIKNLLMDAGFVVGVGNIYASESLFRAGVRPNRQALKLTLDECRKLSGIVRQILEESIVAGGSSISDYVQANGESGSFQDRFKVYDREKKPCVLCGTPIRRTVQAGRSTFFCRSCQR